MKLHIFILGSKQQVFMFIYYDYLFSASFIKICHRSDPNFSDCLKESVNSLKPMLKKGIPELDIPSCEPLFIPELIVDQGTGAVNIKSKYRDIQVYGPSNFVLKSVK